MSNLVLEYIRSTNINACSFCRLNDQMITEWISLLQDISHRIRVSVDKYLLNESEKAFEINQCCNYNFERKLILYLQY